MSDTAVPSRTRAGRRPLISKEQIVAVTLTLVDAHGLDAVSMRRLAEMLGVRAPSIYNHVRTKEEILDAVAESIVSQVVVSGFEVGWEEGLTQWARSYYEALAAHPNMVPWFAKGPKRNETSLRAADQVFGGLRAAGWPPSWATRIGAATRHVVFGAAIGSFAAGFPEDPQAYGARYPHLAEAYRLHEHRELVDRGSFELGLRCLVSGLREVYVEVGQPSAAGTASESA